MQTHVQASGYQISLKLLQYVIDYDMFPKLVQYLKISFLTAYYYMWILNQY